MRRGQPICLVETSKASIEILAPDDGVLRHLASAGSEVPIGGALGAIAATADEPLAIKESTRPVPSSAPGRVSRRAAELAAAHAIDLADVKSDGYVTVTDVEALIASQGGAPRIPGLSLSLEGVTLPDVYTAEGETGALDEAFLCELRANPEAFASLPSSEKRACYRDHGAAVGDDVEFGSGSYVLAPRIVLENGVVLRDRCSVECGEVFAAGATTLIGADVEVRCRRVYIGRGGYVGRSVRVGGGGNRDPRALLVLGDLAYIGDEAFINAGRPVIAGSEVFITMRSAIVTHNIGHSILEGYENRHSPVVIEDRAQIGIGTVVYAGCRIGRGAIIASNSYVVTDIPADKLAIGVPARVAGDARHPPAPRRIRELAETMVDELRELLVLSGRDVRPLGGAARRGFTVVLDDGVGRVLLVDRADETSLHVDGPGETVALALKVAGEPPDGIVVLDLLARRVYGEGGVLLETVREFCRKQGIRFGPEPWRYRGGLI